jgi:cytochrome c551/c552
MKGSFTAAIIGAGLVLAAGSVHAQDAKMGEAKAKEAGCLGCHAVGSAKVGPSFRDVAKKFGKQGDKILAAVKADKTHADVIKGAKDDDLKLIANWIASL